MNEAVNLDAKFATFTEHWAPRLVATYNGNDIRIVKVEGEFVWHTHDDTDDFFLVLDGVLDIELRDRTVTLGPGELYVVPRGVEHRPVARRGEVRLINIEPGGTHNLGEGSPQRPPSGLVTRPMETSVRSAAPMQMRMLVRNPAGLPFSSRSSPISAPHRAAAPTCASPRSRPRRAPRPSRWWRSPTRSTPRSRGRWRGRSGCR